MADKDIETKELTLIVKEKTIGSLVTNALEIQNWVKERLSDYSPENYTGNVDDAKKARAELNKAADKLNSERLNLEREFMKPFNEFKDVVKQTTNLINDASNRLDRIVKAKELEEKELRKYDLKQLWDSKCDFIPFEKVLNPKWLNKTAKIDDISCQMKNMLHTINLNIKALEDNATDEEVVIDKAFYLECLDYNRTLNNRETRRRNIQKLEEMKKAEQEKSVVKENLHTDVKEPVHFEKPVVSQDEKTFALNVIGSGKNLEKITKIVNDLGIEIVKDISIKVTASQAAELKKQMADMGLSYTKQNFLTLDVQ